MNQRRSIPVVLTIAGSDSGGGAGVQADLKTFRVLGVHGASAITCVTAQNPGGVLGVQAVRPELVGLQLEAVWDDLAPAAAKTGMLYSRAIIERVAGTLEAHARIPVVVDPVMVATSGARLLEPGAVRALCRRLLPRARVITPNVPEAEALTGLTLAGVEDLRGAAKQLAGEYGCAVLVKGGHLRGLREAVDVLRDGENEWLLSAPYLAGVSTHGTGCTYSAAVAAYLARGRSLLGAVQAAKELVTRAIAGSVRVGRHLALDPTAGGPRRVGGGVA